MKNAETERDEGLRRALSAVAIAGVVLTLLAPFALGTRAIAGAAIGAALAFANLWAVAFIVRGFLRGAGVPFGVAGALKFAALLFLVWIVVKNGWADVTSLVLGYVALPLGIVIGQLGRSAPSSQKA